MEYKNYYVIRHGDKNYLVLAKSSQEAINIWIQAETAERSQDRPKIFNPRNFSIEEITREDFIIKASE